MPTKIIKFKTTLLTFFLMVVFLLPLAISAQENNLKAFPDAQGFGAYTKGGRGGAICKVTNLNDSGSGSLRYCMEIMVVPRTVIFEISGTIELQSPIWMKGEANSYVTVAGQTAPGQGIQLKNHPLIIGAGTHDVIIRYLRIRPGMTGGDADGLLILGSDQNGPNHVYNVMIDHVSMEWAVDETVGAWDWVTDTTIQNSIIAEGTLTGHPEGAHSCGLLNGHNPAQHSDIEVSIYKNLFAHNQTRNPKLDSGLYDFRNNLVYDWIGTVTALFAGGAHMNLVNNHYIFGPSSKQNILAGDDRIFSSADSGTQIYSSGNWTPRCPSGTCSMDWNIGWFNADYLNYKSDTEFSVPLTETIPTSQVKSTVLADVGANRCNGDTTTSCRDAVDLRIINEVDKNTGRVGPDSIYIPSGQSESYYVNSFGFVNAASASTLTDLISNDVYDGKIANWPVDGYAGKYIKITFGNGAGQICQIASNTADTLTYVDGCYINGLEVINDSGFSSTRLNTNSRYEIREFANSWDWWPTLSASAAPTDTDNDGMPDKWEISNGLNPNLAMDGNLDANSDGYTNLEEYLNGNSLSPICTPGDANSDGNINISDVQTCINVILGTDTTHQTCSDMNTSNTVDITDCQAIINKILNP